MNVDSVSLRLQKIDKIIEVNKGQIRLAIERRDASWLARKSVICHSHRRCML